MTCRHLNTGKSLFKYQVEDKGDRQINCFDLSRDGETLGIVGAEPQVLLLDVETQKIRQRLTGEEGNLPGHSNRVFSIKFEEDQNLVLTSGWDQRIILWDLRAGLPQSNIFNTRIYGDGLDVNQGLILACNHQETDQVHMYDLMIQKRIDAGKNGTFQWNGDAMN